MICIVSKQDGSGVIEEIFLLFLGITW